MIFQKSAFLASEAGVQLSVHFHKKVASGLFGGEGFVLQKVSGQGVAFAEFDGHVVEYELHICYNDSINGSKSSDIIE